MTWFSTLPSLVVFVPQMVILGWFASLASFHTKSVSTDVAIIFDEVNLDQE